VAGVTGRPGVDEPEGPAPVTLVCVAFHRPLQIGRLAAGFSASPVELLVVNVDADPQVAAAVAGSGATVVDLPGNPGFAAGVNAGAAAASGQIVVFANDDVELAPEAVRALAGAIERDAADVAVPAVRTGTGAREPTICALPTPGALLREWALLPDHPFPGGRRAHVEKWRSPSGPERIDAAAAVVVAVRAELLRAVPLPEDYFLYWEEQEWFWRLRERGDRVSYRPEAVVSHRGGRRDLRPEKARLLARNAVRCVRRTQGRFKATLAWPIVILWNLRVLCVDVVRAATGNRPSRERLQSRRAGLRSAIGAWRELA
jgi:GT2 family glycosyltransferase